MNSQTLRTLLEAGAVKTVRIIADGGHFRVEIVTPAGSDLVRTVKGKLKTWGSLDATGRWLHRMGIGRCQLELDGWQPGQNHLNI